MKIINLENQKAEKLENANFASETNYFLLCHSNEILELQPYFGFDKTTIVDCLNYDEVIRMETFLGYDFISLMFFWWKENIVFLNEMNLYVGPHFLVLVVPEIMEEEQQQLVQELLQRAKTPIANKSAVNKLYFDCFDLLIRHFSDTMELLEDEINLIEASLQGHVTDHLFQKIATLKQSIYVIKKQIRGLLYVADHFLVNENNLILKENLKFFKNVDVRINKLYDFAVNLQDYANQTLYSYDSKMTTQTNHVINKLTTITLFFGPLTVITGIYGMNFSYMPELEWGYGYPMVLGAMFIVSFVLYMFLKRKKWL